jgi:predicted nucleic acid-binding protein
MSFLIDTDICSAHLRANRAVNNRFMQYIGQLHVSTVTLGELYTWVDRKSVSPRHREALLALVSDVTVLDVDHDVAQMFGAIRAQLLDRGTPVAGMDLLIAATALVHDLTLVTHNRRHFANVPRLTVYDWSD